jgi:hypothetical protein
VGIRLRVEEMQPASTGGLGGDELKEKLMTTEK